MDGHSDGVHLLSSGEIGLRYRPVDQSHMARCRRELLCLTGWTRWEESDIDCIELFPPQHSLIVHFA